MTKRSTKHSLLMSAISLLLCASMLIGTTFAWFTDSVTSTGNKIQSGTLVLDLELLTKDSNGDYNTWKSIKEDKTPIFNYSNWEPGYTEVKVLRVQNEGTLALKWYAKFVTDAGVNVSELAKVIDVYVCPSEAAAIAMPDGRDLNDYTHVGTLDTFLNTITETTKGTLMPEGDVNNKDEAYLGIALKMQESAGNEYQNLDLAGAFDIQILATQLEYEEDSFDKEYDKPATYPAMSTAVTVPDSATAPVTLKTDDLSVALPADLLNSLPSEVESLKLGHTDPVVNADTESVTFDSVEIYDQDGNVVDLEALGNTEAFTATLPVSDYFADGDVVKIFHDGTQISEATVTNGSITYTATHFCEVTVSKKIFVTVVFSDGFTKNFNSLGSAMRFGYSGGAQEKIIVNEDITEAMDYLEGNIVCGKEGGVTITNTIYDEWVYCDSTNFTIGEGVTYDVSGNLSGLFVYGDDCVINGTVITDCYYQRYADSKLTINAPGSMKVNTETFILRYTDSDANAGIYINGDNDDSTVEFNLAVAYFYQGMISAKDATLKVGTYWQTNGTDGEGSANLVLDNSKLTVTVNEHDFKATGNSNVTLKNGSVLDVAGGIETTTEIVVDQTSTVKRAR